MSGIHDQERLEALRKRLYSRGKGPKKPERFKLKDTPEKVPEFWEKPPQAEKVKKTTQKKPEKNEDDTAKHVSSPVSQASVKKPSSEPVIPDIAPMAIRTKRHSYRIKVLVGAVAFFVLATLASSVYLMIGGNTISGDNIAVSITGPFTIGGGEAMPLQVGITNQNAVPIESATLIIEYPLGTQSADEEGKELFVEQLPLETIDTGETVNIPVRAVVFGEENEEKTITAAVEYRVRGSNATFFKEAEPLRFKISSSPIVVSVEALHKISSGQETDIELTIRSNTPTELSDLLIRADYPIGFDFTSSNPDPVSGENVWLIESLLPEDEKKITIRGVIIGKEADEHVMHFSAGVANERDPLELASIFSTASTEFEIEQPFIDVDLSINRDTSGNISSDQGDTVQVNIEVTNTLEDTIYDGNIEVKLSGNALSDFDVRAPGGGFYDSTRNTIVWNASDLSRLREMRPGQSVLVRFTLTPDARVDTTPQINVNVDVHARRALEDRVSEELIGTASSIVKINSIVDLASEAGRNTSVFSDTGPIPPEAEERTSYTITFFAQNGSNDIGDVEVTAALPTYVRWENRTSGAGAVTYNENTRTITWRVDSIDANESALAAFQVSLLPSISQIGTTPTLVGKQLLRATDRFTEDVLRTENFAITTELSTEAGFSSGNGEVIEP